MTSAMIDLRRVIKHIGNFITEDVVNPLVQAFKEIENPQINEDIK